MKFNLGKCEVPHFGRSNVKDKNTDNGRTLNSINAQRDIEVHVHSSLKVTAQVDRVVKKAYGMLAFLGRGIEYKSQDVVLLQLYETLVRPHLKYCNWFWLPHYRKNVEALERLQKRFTRMLPSLEGMNYKERLEKLRLFSLEQRTLTGDLIEVYKIMRCIDRVDGQNLFPRVEMPKTWWHAFKARRGKFKGDFIFISMRNASANKLYHRLDLGYISLCV
eukprot:g38893.t1